MQPLASLDLFSGIGGLSLALRDVLHPVAYCDICPSARSVLRGRIADRSLPDAPIYHDVKSLTVSELPSARVDVIVAGFPCVGFSSMGLRTAFTDGDGSGLFGEVLRLSDELNPVALFLENVPGVLTMGMPTLVEQLCQQRGFDISWCVVGASEVGAPHSRKRWFCLATRSGAVGDLLLRLAASLTPTDSLYPSYTERWASCGDGVPRMVVLDPLHQGCMGCARSPAVARRPADVTRRICINTRRLELLGNSVVPDAVRSAFRFLVGGLDVSTSPCPAPTAPTAYVGDDSLPNYVGDDSPPSTVATHQPSMSKPLRRWPTHGRYIASTCTLSPHAKGPSLTRPIPYLSLVVQPAAFTGVVREFAQGLGSTYRSPAVMDDRRLRLWATPRFNCPRPACSVTARTMKDLPTQLRFEKDTPDDVRKGYVAPEFLEWIMGYPIGWTAFGGTDCPPSPSV